MLEVTAAASETYSGVALEAFSMYVTLILYEKIVTELYTESGMTI